MQSTIRYGWVLASALSAATASAQQRDTTATGDTLRVSRPQAIADALAHNPQLEVAHEQVEEARAQRRQDWAIPDPKNLTPNDFRKVVTLIEERVQDLIAEVRHEGA